MIWGYERRNAAAKHVAQRSPASSIALLFFLIMPSSSADELVNSAAKNHVLSVGKSALVFSIQAFRT